MKNKFVLALDVGTTKVSATIFDHECRALFTFNDKLTQYSKQPGWYEQDPTEIWDKVMYCITNLLIISKIKPTEICSIGLSNQRETTIIWEKNTGKPIYNALAWESRQTEPLVKSLTNQGLADFFHQKTGLFINSYFSATKIIWILEQVSNARSMAQKGQLLFGTIDSWIVWKLSQGALHITDYTNASRTMLFNINELQWDSEILDTLKIPSSMLPEVKSNSEIYGYTNPQVFFGAKIPIAAVAGDQQAAMIGELATQTGDVEGTYGTGAFIIMNTGEQLIKSSRHLLSTIAYHINGKCVYAIEGSIFVAGSALQWLKDKLQMIENISDAEMLAEKSTDNGRLYLIPSFTGLSAPYWNSNANAATFGMTQNTTKYDYIRATLESIAYQTNDILTSMAYDSDIEISKFSVNGEVVKQTYVPQFLADISGIKIYRDSSTNTDLRGVAYLAGMAVGFWRDFSEIATLKKSDDLFTPSFDPEKRKKLYQGWRKAVKAIEFYTDE